MSPSSLLVVLLACASTIYANAIPEPMITAAAVLPRQDSDQRFIGFYSEFGETTWDTARCAVSSSWTVSGSYGRCCSSGLSCDFATRCSSDYAMVAGSSVLCSYTCNTDYIYASTGGSFSTKWVGCAYGYTSTLFYETAPATAVVNTFGASTDTTDGVSRPTVTVLPSPTPTPTIRKKKKSMIWIVGVVIGIVAIFAIAGIIACILITRKKKKARAALAAGQGNTLGNAPPGNFQQPMQQQYAQGPPPTMVPMGQQQYGPPPPEGGYYTAGDPKNSQLYPQSGTQSPPPPVWTPSQHHSPTQPPPVSPQTRHASLSPSDVLAVDQQRAAGNMSPGGTVSEIGSSTNNLGSNPNLPPQSPTGTHLTNISEMNTPPTHPAQVAKIPMQAHNNQGPVSELQ